jgi:hypothetical protein
MPLARIEAANSSSRSARKTVRGCTGFGVIESIERDKPSEALEGTLVVGGGGRGGRRLERPLPSGLCVFSFPVLILKYFPCQLNVAFRAPRTGIVHKNRLPMAGSLRKTDTSRNDRG